MTLSSELKTVLYSAEIMMASFPSNIRLPVNISMLFTVIRTATYGSVQNPGAPYVLTADSMKSEKDIKQEEGQEHSVKMLPETCT